jgi:hypothetical protein
MNEDGFTLTEDTPTSIPAMVPSTPPVSPLDSFLSTGAKTGVARSRQIEFVSLNYPFRGETSDEEPF